MGVAGFGLGFLDIGQDLFAAQQIAFTGLGQRDASGGAVEQAGLQMGLKVGDARDTLAVVVSSCTAAAVKLPASATQLKARMFCKVSMECSQGR